MSGRGRAGFVVGLLSLSLPLALTVASPATGGGTAKWLTISSGNVGTTGTTPSIARFGHTYEVVWVAKAGSKWSVQGRVLNAAGKPTGSVITLVKDWAGIALDPTILGVGSQRLLAFGGDRTGTSGPYESDAEYFTTSSNGTSWTLNSGSLSAADLARVGGAAVVNAGGTIITGLARKDGVQYHVGASTLNPASGTDPLTATTGNFSGEPGLGVDQKTHRGSPRAALTRSVIRLNSSSETCEASPPSSAATALAVDPSKKVSTRCFRAVRRAACRGTVGR